MKIAIGSDHVGYELKGKVIAHLKEKGIEDGQVVTVEVENEEDFEPVMDRVVNIFRRIDDKSEVSYKFGLNRE